MAMASKIRKMVVMIVRMRDITREFYPTITSEATDKDFVLH
jgi:hypothetical protein